MAAALRKFFPLSLLPQAHQRDRSLGNDLCLGTGGLFSFHLPSESQPIPMRPSTTLRVPTLDPHAQKPRPFAQPLVY